jgi:phosphotransferase system enzyme I (PtsI)
MRRGIPVSPGVAVGTAYCLNEVFLGPATAPLAKNEVAAELSRYDAARDRAERDLLLLEERVAAQVGREESAIFAAHRSILRDPAFVNTVRAGIVDQHLTVQAALRNLLTHYTDLFSRVQDDYLRERLIDIRDVVLRINSHLADEPDSQEEGIPAGPLIVVADELLPSQVGALLSMDVKGIVTQAGSQTSHAAIVARSLGIPAVSAVRDLLHYVKTGDTLVVDGREGRVHLAPDPESLAAYRKLEREFFLFRDQLAENHASPAVTADGVPIELLANVNSTHDARAAVAMGATGVGLFRTEYLYLTHPTVPSEEEQLAEYRSVIEASPGHSVTIRSLDLGGDKTMPFLGRMHRESNPFMGWRSIRLCFEHPEFLSTQLRAVMRAADYARQLGGEVRLMFPMITIPEEIYQAKGLVRRARRQLREQGHAFADVPVGMMLEVPAAAISIHTMLDMVDFVSIGSNDLVQYLMAADRDNPKVSHLCQPLAPPVLRVLQTVIQTCTQARKPLTLCGEMAGLPGAFALLVGMGLRSLSMSPAFVPYIKEFARHLSLREAEELLLHALTLRTTPRVKKYLSDRLTGRVPQFEGFNIV